MIDIVLSRYLLIEQIQKYTTTKKISLRDCNDEEDSLYARSILHGQWLI